MERKKYLLIILFSLIFIFTFGQTNKVIYNAFIDGKMDLWKTEIERLEKSGPNNNTNKLALVNYQIGYIGWCIGMENYAEAKKHIEIAQNHLDELKKIKYKPSYVKSFQGSLDGLKAGVNNFSIAFLGYSILTNAESSIELDPKNPFGYILLGNIKYYMWAMMGGSKETAIQYYEKAEKIMRDESMDNKNWNYLSLITLIAHAFVEMERYDDANNYYQKILKVEPNYKWIRDEVYPQFLKEYGKK